MLYIIILRHYPRNNREIYFYYFFRYEEDKIQLDKNSKYINLFLLAVALNQPAKLIFLLREYESK